MTDVNGDLGHGNGHGLVLHFADPGVELLSAQDLLQALKRLQVVGHDEDHGGLLLAQRHTQHKQVVLLVLVEIIQTCQEGRVSETVLGSPSDQKREWNLTGAVHHLDRDGV